ncbi:tRNA pseudouridine(55) synthase TruB [Hymenobacter rubripertinctus]|uniref:tRNA pseudouridine synthase B n=1 Tax=Hymenobacter rubripertinctus TaxID=2029981 RepID=A0A418R469_9BACT|nr:tRNA pseudouridine(55) synthase TruB [Hymenobacter rubripertinctus]RIY12164.1 tRNA pseudouridine(55) synthase TruB [Hymenobacter rubripertinctus]
MSELNLSAFDFEAGEVLLVNKPLTWSSFDVVRKVKNTLRIKKIGHAGTLDPLATGLLILCTGKKTKQIDLIQAQQKEYTGTFRLGQTTPSFDLETPVDQEQPYAHLTEAAIRAAVAQFLGEITQTPPLFSAVKVNGERAYEVARRGEQAVIKSKQVTLEAFELTRIELPEVDFRITCSKGTYIRSLARDLGLALGCGAHLTKLVRTRIGEYALADALTMDQLQALAPPRPEGEANRPPRPRRERQPERRAGLEYFNATHAAAPESESEAAAAGGDAVGR